MTRQRVEFARFVGASLAPALALAAMLGTTSASAQDAVRVANEAATTDTARDVVVPVLPFTVPATPPLSPETSADADRSPQQPAEPAPAPALRAEPVQSPPPAVPTFGLAEELNDQLQKVGQVSGADRDDRRSLQKFYQANGGTPLWVGPNGATAKARRLAEELAAADQWGLDDDQFKLPALANDGANRDKLAADEVRLSLAALKYARHARGGRLDPTALSRSLDRKPTLVPADDVIADLAKTDDAAAYLRGLHPQHPQFQKLREIYAASLAGRDIEVAQPPASAAPPFDAKKGADGKKGAEQKKTLAPPSQAQLRKKVLANLEMWRWMPVDLGDTYIMNNIPEFTTKVVKAGRLVHQERIIVGKPETQTPVFSDAMELVVFQPFWNVPESIKWKELHPQLMRSGGALQKAGLKAAYNGREVDPASVDWYSADMRAFHIYQPPGAANALGQVKFLFPNKHDVYMHDTPTKNLFNATNRAFSHGCMRVRDPLKFAEIVLGEDKGWNMTRIADLANRGPQNNEIKLSRRIPVHVTYFTAVVDDDGRLKTMSDLYGHEQRVHLGLEGKMHLIAQPREIKTEDYRKEAALRAQQFRQQGGGSWGKSQDPIGNFFKSIFNF
jgi:murein L,D-transpeptidase YcbB/YkuD